MKQRKQQPLPVTNLSEESDWEDEEAHLSDQSDLDELEALTGLDKKALENAIQNVNTPAEDDEEEQEEEDSDAEDLERAKEIAALQAIQREREGANPQAAAAKVIINNVVSLCVQQNFRYSDNLS